MIARLLAIALLAVSFAQADSVKVSTYGAKADGTTDNTAAVTNALTGAKSGGSVSFDVAGTYLVNTSHNLNGNGVGVIIPNPVTITCVPGVVLKTTNTSSIGYIFGTTQSNVTIGGSLGQGCTFDSAAAIDADGSYNTGALLSNLTFSYNTVQNVTSVAGTANGGVTGFGIFSNPQINNNYFFNIWQGGYATDFNSEYYNRSFQGAPCVVNADTGNEYRCIINGGGVAINGQMAGGSISFNRFDEIANDVLSLSNGGYTYKTKFNTGQFGNWTVEGNEMSHYHRFGFEVQGSCDPNDGSGACVYQLRAFSNTTVRNNYIHDPELYWEVDGLSLVMNGAINSQINNNFIAINNPNVCYGGSAGAGIEHALNTGSLTGNVVSSVVDACGSTKGWNNYFMLGNYDSFNDTNIPRQATYTNNMACGPAATSAFGEDNPNGDGYGNFPPTQVHVADALVSSCANASNLLLSNPALTFTSGNNQSISGNGTFNVAVTDNLPIAIVQFFVDGSTTAVVTQYTQDTNNNFTTSNPQWLYHATFNTSTLTTGSHTIKAVATDVSGLPHGVTDTGSGGTANTTQNFTVTGGIVGCVIATNSLPTGTVGTAYSAALSQNGCGTGTWSITTGNPPSGLSLNATTGAITGTPSVAGTTNFMVSYSTATANANLSITINAATANGTGCGGEMNGNNGLFADTFTTSALGSCWTVLDSVGGSRVTTGSGQTTIAVPSGKVHDAYTSGNGATLLAQHMSSNADFNVTAKFTSVPNAAFESEGLQAIQDNSNEVRCEVLYTGSGYVGYAAYLSGSNVNTYSANAISQSTAPYYINLTRTGNSWSCQVSPDNSTWTSIATFSQTLTVNQVAITADTGDAGGGAPAFNEVVSSFSVAGSAAPPPPPPPTGPTFGESPVTFAPVSLSSSFVIPKYAVTLTSTTPGTFTNNSNLIGSLQTVDSTHAVYTAPASIPSQRSLAGCMVMPNDSIFNTRIDNLPVNSQSSTWMDTTTDRGALVNHLTSASALAFTVQDSFAYNVIDNTAPTSTQSFYYTPSANSSVWQFPSLASAKREGGAYATSGSFDHHEISVNYQNCNFFETYQQGDASLNPGTTGQSGFAYTDRSYVNPNGTTDAAGLPLLPLTLTGQDVLEAVRTGTGVINHAIRFTSAPGYINLASTIWPADTTATKTGYTCSAAPCINTFSLPYGSRIRMRSSVNTSGLTSVTINNPSNIYGPFPTGVTFTGCAVSPTGTVNMVGQNVNSISITNPGSGCTNPTATLIGGTCSGGNCTTLSAITYSPYAQAILNTFKEYGLFMADAGSSNAITADASLTSDPNVWNAIQQIVNAHYTMSSFEAVDESTLQTTWGGVNSTEAVGGVAQAVITFTPTTGTPVTFPIVLKPISIGTPFQTPVGILAGEPAYQLPSWVNGDPTNSGVTWSLSSCSAGSGNCGSLTSTGSYTPPASLTAGTTVRAILTATSVADPNQSTGVYMVVYGSADSVLRVDSGASVPYTDSTGKVWTPEQYGQSIDNAKGVGIQDDTSQASWYPTLTDIKLAETAVMTLSGTSGSGDIYANPFILPSAGVYDLHLLFAVTTEGNGYSSCVGNYGPSNKGLTNFNVTTNGTLQSTFDLGIQNGHLCRFPATLDAPIVVASDRLAKFAVDAPSATYPINGNQYAGESMLNAFSIASDPGPARFVINTQQQNSIAPGSTLQLGVMSYSTANDPIFSIIGGPGKISPNGLYYAPQSNQVAQYATIKACSSSQPTVCGTTRLLVNGAFLR